MVLTKSRLLQVIMILDAATQPFIHPSRADLAKVQVALEDLVEYAQSLPDEVPAPQGPVEPGFGGAPVLPGPEALVSQSKNGGGPSSTPETP